MSASSTYISSLKLINQHIHPAFKQNVFQYECSVKADCPLVQASVVVADKNTKIEIARQEQKESDDGDGLFVKLNFGKTLVKVCVTSPDASRTVCYEIHVFRDRFLFPVRGLETKFECGICLNVSHCAVCIDDMFYCQLCFQIVTRINKRNPSTNQVLDTDLTNQSEERTEHEISIVDISCFCGEKVLLGEICQHVEDNCPKKLTRDEKTGIIHMNGSKVCTTFIRNSAIRNY